MAISNEHSQTRKTQRFQKPKGREFWINEYFYKSGTTFQ